MKRKRKKEYSQTRGNKTWGVWSVRPSVRPFLCNRIRFSLSMRVPVIVLVEEVIEFLGRLEECSDVISADDEENGGGHSRHYTDSQLLQGERGREGGREGRRERTREGGREKQCERKVKQIAT